MNIDHNNSIQLDESPPQIQFRSKTNPNAIPHVQKAIKPSHYTNNEMMVITPIQDIKMINCGQNRVYGVQSELRSPKLSCGKSINHTNY